MFCVYFSESETKMIIKAETVEINQNEVVYKDKKKNVVAYFDRSKIKGTVKVSGEIKVI